MELYQTLLTNVKNTTIIKNGFIINPNYTVGEMKCLDFMQK